MLVRRNNFEAVIATLQQESILALDLETTGLRPYHGDRIFSVIIATEEEGFYFNFKFYETMEIETLLSARYLQALRPLFEAREKMWGLHNAKFDLAFLAQEGLHIAGKIHCTRALARIEYNEFTSYSLDACLKRIGLAKDDKVDAYIKEHKLWTTTSIPGKKTTEKRKHYDQVPFEVILPYGIDDAVGTYALMKHQITSIAAQGVPANTTLSPVSRVMENERRLTKTVFAMERTGVLIDPDYCERAIAYETQRVAKAEAEYLTITGGHYKASSKVFAEHFKADLPRWKYTEKNNPSFDSGVLKTFESPAAKCVLEIRDGKSKADFYGGFLYHRDAANRIHPNFNPDGAAHGRFSSSSPNFQNLTGEDVGEFVIRRAIIPTPGFCFIMPDYDQMEYRFMLEIACQIIGHETELVKLIKTGIDVHTATAQIASQAGVTITRDQAKTSNFLSIYGGGSQKLADGLKCSLSQAHKIRRAIFDGAPEMEDLIRSAIGVVKQIDGNFIINWLGRRCYFPDTRWAYRAPNYLIAGGCADIVKVAMNDIHDYLQDKRSRLVMTVHDELVVEVYKDEIDEIPKVVKTIMENTYQSKYLPLTCGMEHSWKSLGEKSKGFPTPP